jgi:hypothetical protein
MVARGRNRGADIRDEAMQPVRQGEAQVT